MRAAIEPVVFMSMKASVILLAVAGACTAASAPEPAKRTEPVAKAEPADAPEPADVPVKAGRVPVAIDLDLDALGLPADLRRDWLEKDVQLVARFSEAFPLGSVDDVVGALDDEGDSCTPNAQGFGIEARNCRIGGGYTTCFVTFASHEGRVFDARAGCRTNDRSAERVAPLFEKLHASMLAPRGFVREANVATLHHTDSAARAKALATIAAELGPPSGAVVPTDLEQPFALLGSPRASVVVGTHCGAAGSPPDGNRAMRQLVDAGRDDLLRDLLHGMNAGGRVYGYVGLRLLRRNTSDDDAVFDELAALGLKLETCGGCSIDRQTAGDIDLAPFER